MQANDDIGPCLEPETLAAWMDGGLSAGERAAAEAHASTCDRCQAMLATLVRSEPPPSRPLRWWSGGAVRWMVPIVAGAIALAIWVAVDPGLVRPLAPASPAAAPEVPRSSGPASSSNPAKDRLDAVAPRPVQPVAPRDEARSAANSPTVAAPHILDKGVAAPRSPAAAHNEMKTDATAAAPAPAAAAIAGVPAAPAAAPNASAAPRASADKFAALTAEQASVDIISPSSGTRWRIVAPDRVDWSSDRGGTWVRTELPAGAQVTAGASPAARTCWLVGRNGLVLRTTNGSTWTPITFPQPLALVGVRSTGIDAAVVTSDTGLSFATTDGGRSWVLRQP